MRACILRSSRKSASHCARVTTKSPFGSPTNDGAKLVSPRFATTRSTGVESRSPRSRHLQHWKLTSPLCDFYRHTSRSSYIAPLNYHNRLSYRSYIVLPSNLQELLSITSDALQYYILGKKASYKQKQSRANNRLLLLKAHVKQRAAMNYKYANTTIKNAMAVQNSTIQSVTSSASAKRHSFRIRRRRVLKIFGDKVTHYKGRLRRSIRSSYTKSAGNLDSHIHNNTVPTSLNEATVKLIFTRRAKRFLRRYVANATGASLRRDFQSAILNSPTLLRRLSQDNGLKLVELTDINDGCRFDTEGYPLVSCAPNYTVSVLGQDHQPSTRYINPWSASSCEHEPLTKFARWQLHRIFHCKDRIPKDHGHYLARTNPYMSKLTTKDLPHRSYDDTTRVGFTWIGHSTCLVQMHGFTILTDPVFSNVVGPMAPLLGDKRYVQPSHTVDELGDTLNGPLKHNNGVIDIVCISHDHYDHLDYSSIYQLVTSDKVHVKKWCVPLGFKKWLLDHFGIEGKGAEDINVIHDDDVMECSWWDEHTILKPDSNTGTIKQMKITCAPAQHWCARTPFDRNSRLWASFAFEASAESDSDDNKNRLAFYFAGDTGVPDNGFPLFAQIGDRLGPFDLSALPIGAYLPNHYIGDSHIGPRDALQISDDLRSKQNVAIHWGTFPMGGEPFYDPCRRAHLATEEIGDSNKLMIVRQGEHFLTSS